MKKLHSRTIVTIMLLALIATLLPLAVAHAATWTELVGPDPGALKPKGFGNAQNLVLVPGEIFQGKIAIGSVPLPGGIEATSAVSMWTYNGSAFTKVGSDGFGNPNCHGLIPSVSYHGQLYIGMYDDVGGGAVYRWSGSGNPELVKTAAGLGLTPVDDYTIMIPLGIVNDQLIVCIENSTTGINGSLVMFRYDGTTWTQIVGGTSGVPAGFNYPDKGHNKLCINLAGERLLYNNKLMLTVWNENSGVNVWSYDGTTFQLIGTPASGGWTASDALGIMATSGVDNKVYMGTYSQGMDGGKIFSWDGSAWAKVVDGGITSTNNAGLFPYAKGTELYVGTWNSVAGGSVFKRSGAGFTQIATQNFGQPLPDINAAVMLKSYGGKLLATTGSPFLGSSGGEVYSSPVPPSIDSLVPSSGPYGITLRVLGNDFGPTQGTSKITIGGVEIKDIASWADDEIDLVVPPRITTGNVRVSTSWGVSNKVLLTLTLSNDYYFAEGTTRANANDGAYEEWISIQNPGDSVANVTLTYMLGDGTTKVQTVPVVKKSRMTVSVNAFLGPDKDVSTLVHSDKVILAERPMYFNYRNKWTGGHDVIGLSAPRKNFYFAEGTTRDNVYDGSYEVWLCLQNPGDTEADVNVTYMLGSGQNIQKNYKVPKTSRRTIDVNLDVGKDQDVSMVVTSKQDIVAERPMYFNYRNKWTGGHDVIGAPGPDTKFYFAEGTTRDNANDGSYETWICLQNANDADANVNIAYYTAGAGIQSQDVTVPKKSRHTVDVKLKLGADVDTSFIVSSNVPVLAERPTYFNFRSVWDGGHDVIGCAAPKKSFYFAEGTTRVGFSTWVAVMNTADTRANVTFRYMLADGSNKEAKVTVDPKQRYTREVIADVGPDQDVSIVVVGDQGIVAERPMYFNYHAWCTGGSDTLGYGI